MPGSNRALGIDVSRWKGQVNWQAVKDAGAVFGIPKTTDGETYVDTTFMDNWRGMKTERLSIVDRQLRRGQWSRQNPKRLDDVDDLAVHRKRNHPRRERQRG